MRTASDRLKSPRTLLMLGLLAGLTLSVTAQADPWHGGHRRGGASVGIYVGPGFYGPGPGWGPYYPRAYYPGPYYPSPYYAVPPYPYTPPVIVTPAPVQVAPPVYIEQTPQQAQAPSPQADSGYWYYCKPAEAYYPYVKECPQGWQKVPAQPAN